MRKNFNITLQDSGGRYERKYLTVPSSENYTPLASRPEFCSDTFECQPLYTNGYMFGGHNFPAGYSKQAVYDENSGYDPHFLMQRGSSALKSQREYASVDSPTLTTNSERSEITEASTDFNFLGGSQQLVRDQQQLDTSQLQSMQHSAYNDMQLLQQQMMFKQMQEIQRQQQLQQFEDGKQGSQNQISAFTRQSTAGQYPSYMNRTSVSEASQIFINRAHPGASSATQGVLMNQLMFSQEKGQSLHSTLMVPQQLDESNYRTLVSSGRGSVGQYSQLQGFDCDSGSVFPMSIGPKPGMQPADFSNSSLGNQSTVSADHFALARSKQGFLGKNLFEQVSIHGIDPGIKSGSIHEKNTLLTNPLFPEFQGRQDGAGSLGSTQRKVTQLDTSQYLVPLDPIEQKILYDIDHNTWDASLGRCSTASNGSFENNPDHSDYSNVFPSLQSGSWSALMQSAVAEASSSDTGIQEEWSGLTFQNTELSTENQHSNIVDSKKEQSAWYENNVHGASSLSSRPYPNFNDSSMTLGFPGFQQPGIQPSFEQTEHLCQEDSHELNQNPSEKASEWLDGKNAQRRHGDQCHYVQPLEHPNNTLGSQIYEQSGYDRPYQQITSNEDVNQPRKPQGQVNEVAQNGRGSRGFPWKADYDIRHHENMKHVNISIDSKDNEVMRKKHNRQMNNGPIGLQNSDDKADDSFLEKLQQRDNSHDQYNLTQSSSQGRGHFGQSYSFDVSSDTMNLEKGQLTCFQRTLKPSDGTHSRGNLEASTNLCKLISSNGPNLYNQTSEILHRSLQNVDQSKEHSTVPHYSSTGSSSSSRTEAMFPNSSVSQHFNQSSSQGSSMRLLHPSQLLSYSSQISSSQGLSQLSSTLNARPENFGFVEKNQTSSALPSSILFMPPSGQSLQNSHWDEKSHCLEKVDAATSLFMPPHLVTDETQVQFTSSAPVAQLSPQASMPNIAYRYPQFELASSQDTSRNMNNNLFGKQYPVLESRPVSLPLAMSGLGQQGGLSVGQPNVWSNNRSLQHIASMEANKIGALNNTFEATSLASQGFNEQHSQKCGIRLLESDMIPTNSQEYFRRDETPEHKARSDICDTLLGGELAKKIPHANALSSFVYPQQQDLNRMQIVDKSRLTTSGRDPLLDHFSKLPHIVSQQYSLQKVNSLKNMVMEPKAFLDPHQATAMSKEDSTRENPKRSGQHSASELNSLPSESRKMLNLLTEGGEDHKVEALPENPLNTCSRDFTSDSQIETKNEFNGKNMEGNNEKTSQINPLMVPPWFKFRNGQIPSMHNQILSKNHGGPFFLMKPSENLYKHQSLDEMDSTDINQSGRVWSSAATIKVVTDPLSAPCGLPSIASGPAAILRPKKRKSEASELQPWHIEVRGSQRVMNISMAEQDWAQTTNRLPEKVENELEMVEDGHTVLRSKRRLILTTQLLQQLVCPAPSSVLSADASSFYDSVVYSILRSLLGDACSLMCGKRNDLHVSLSNSNVMSDELETEVCADDKYLARNVERFSTRAGKLENDLQRLDRSTSILDLMVECQELERFSVINRFAKFHVRQADASGNPSSNGLVTLASKSCPQRYVTAHPIPTHFPEGVQCLSL